ncbi:MAG: AI-2E family transporter [Anaerolineae bacterium]|nr:MAG: AI-2E family transporter [Anaerolineae bacterium]
MTSNPSAQPSEWTFRRIVWATLIVLSVVLCFWLLYRFSQVVFILFIAIVIGTATRPAATWLQQRGLPRTAAVTLVYLLILLLLIGFLLVLFPVVLEQGTTIAAGLPEYYASLRVWLAQFPNPLMVRLGEFLPSVIPPLQSEGQTGEEITDSAAQALLYLSTAGQGIFVGIIVLVLAFYWTLDGTRIIQSLLLLIPPGRRESISALVSAMETKVGYFIAGQGILSLTIGVLALIAYWIIGLPNALVLALLAGVLEVVPMVGPLLGAIPAVLVASTISADKLIWVIVATAVIQQFENTLLVPRVMSKAVGVNPFVTLLALFAFSTLFGITGALMAIPMAAIIQLLLNHFVFDLEPVDAEASPGRDHASRLRYLAHDLAQDLRKQARLKKKGSDANVRDIDHLMDEIESITTDLDALLAQVSPSDAQ